MTAYKTSLINLLLLLPLTIQAQNTENSTSIGFYVSCGFLFLFLVLLPLSSINSYRQTGKPRYKTMAIISLLPTILFAAYACLMAEPPQLYYYGGAVLFALGLLASLFLKQAS